MSEETILLELHNSQGQSVNRAIVPAIGGYPPIGSIIRVTDSRGEHRYAIRGYEFHTSYGAQTTFRVVVDEV